MSLIGSFVLFTIFITAYITIIEIFTVLFRLTGLTQEKARMQVISMLTNSGFTTSESEVIVSSKKRRKLAQLTMLFGYSFTVIIVSIIVNVILALNQAEIKHMLASVFILFIFLSFLFILMRLPIIKSRFDYIIEKLGNRIMFGKDSNTLVLIDNFKGSAMVEIYLDTIPDFLYQVPLAKAQIKKIYDIQILSICRNNSTYVTIDGDTILNNKDIIFVFGNYKNIRSIFERPNQKLLK